MTTLKLKPINTVKNISKHFDWVYDWITPEHCPLKPVKGAKEIELIKFDKWISTEDALTEMEAQGYEPAPINYLLALGVEHPEIHREKRWIVSLDKKNLFPHRNGGPCFLCLYWSDGRRLDMANGADDWGDGWWFAVVRKSNSAPLKSSLSDTLSFETLLARLKLVEDALKKHNFL